LEIDLHIHSYHSKDSRSRPKHIIERAIALGLGAIAVTDHDSWAGAMETKKLAGGRLLIVPGAELKTDVGDVLTLFVENDFSTRQYTEVIDEVGSQGGICIIPHPIQSTRMRESDMAMADGIEVFNSKSSPKNNSMAAQLAMRLGKPGFSNSDAHIVREIGNGTTEVADCTDLEALRRCILRNPIPRRMVRSSWLQAVSQAFSYGTKGIRKR